MMARKLSILMHSCHLYRYGERDRNGEQCCITIVTWQLEIS